jgi:hypothetical protein
VRRPFKRWRSSTRTLGPPCWYEYVASIASLLHGYACMISTLTVLVRLAQSELEAKNIRSAHMKMLSDRFQDVSVRASAPRSNYEAKVRHRLSD